MKGHNVQKARPPTFRSNRWASGAHADRDSALLLISPQIAVAQLQRIKAELALLVESDVSPGAPVRAALHVRFPERFHVQSDARAIRR